jgi:hypothetical protein
MFESVWEIGQELQDIVSGLRPDVLEPDEAATLVKEFQVMANVCSAAKALLAAGVADSGLWRSSGDRTAAHWMARSTGTSVGRAVGTRRWPDAWSGFIRHPTVFRSGLVSEAQVKEIAGGGGGRSFPGAGVGAHRPGWGRGGASGSVPGGLG